MDQLLSPESHLRAFDTSSKNPILIADLMYDPSLFLKP